jgi:hypothetical protein
MRRVTARRILEEAWSRFTGDTLESMGTRDFVVFRAALNRWLLRGWQHWFWPEVMRVEARQYRADYAAATTYTAGAEVYWPTDGQYYQALKGTTGVAPTGTPHVWGVCAASFAAATWDVTRAYTPGEQVTYAVNGKVYECHTAAGAGVVPTDVTKWGLRTVFVRSIALDQAGETGIGTPLRVTEKDPRVWPNAFELDWYLGDAGLVVRRGPARVWVEFRLPAPAISGWPWDATRAYAVGSQVYFRDESDAEAWPGDFYGCTATTVAAESPKSASAKWAVVEVPERFGGFLANALHAEAQVADGQVDKKREAEDGAVEWLGNEVTVLLDQMGQQPRAMVRTG